MPSVTSYFNKSLFKGTLGRVWPLWAAYTLVWLFLLPVTLFTNLNDRHIVYSTVELSRNVLNISITGGLIMAAFSGIFFAMAVFAYLSNSRATGGLHAMPIRRGGLFLTHYAAGLFCQVTTLLLTYAFAALVVAGAGKFDAYAIGAGLLINLELILLFYSFGTLCVICAGQTLAGPVFYGILNFLAVGMESMLRAFAGNFLYGYDDRYGFFVTAFLSPVVKLVRSLRVSFIYNDPAADAYYDITYNIDLATGVKVFGLGTLTAYALVGVVLTVLALLLYRSRKSESTSSTVAIEWLRPVFKYGVALCSAFTLGQLLSYFVFELVDSPYTSGALVGTILCMIFAGLIGYYAAEMLLKKSFRVFKTSWKGALATVIVLVLVGLSFPLDLTGYQTYVPEQSEIEEATVRIYTDGNINGHFTLRDAQSIALLRDAHHAVITDKARQTSPEYMMPQEHYCNFDITYHLADGSSVSRNYELGIRESMLDDPTSPESALLSLVTCPEITQQRILGNAMPDDPESFRITGGYVDCNYYSNGEYDHSDDAELDAIQANNVFIALMQDCVEGNIAEATLFGRNEPGKEPTTVPGRPDDYYLSLELWYYDASDTPHTAAVKRYHAEATVEYNASFYTNVTPEMTATTQAIRALNLIAIPH